ncbi:hypothetical protein RclHR1_14240003 [Rhizophagus clarus]|uniref:Uncharacterized protein n=1 Tax=Rhizophagus clarus TaxID=94130 RepID=A0A2Z6QRR6_9GLOM|nr:hypothetical protein RclHR1_14240003 [Rhizophagus clarus]
MFQLTQVACGIEFIAITVSNNDELRSHWFGSNVGEDFYRAYNFLNESIVPFRCFSILKRKEKVEKIRYVEPSNILENTMEKSPSDSGLLNDLNFAKPNSTDARDKVRAILKRKFDVQGGIIPYKKWKNQTLYKVIGCPSNVEFKVYASLNSKERLEVLNSLDNIKFEFQ